MAEPQQVGTGDARSPTTLILDYLNKKGYQPNSANIRTALEESFRNPGLIPGLINDRPSTKEEDQAAMLNKAMAPRGNTGPINDQSNTASAPGETARGSGDGDPKTSAAPTSEGGGVGPLGLSVLLGLPAAAGMYGASKIPAMPGAAPTPGGAVAPMPDVGEGVPGIAAPEEMKLLTGPQPSLIDSAMLKAIQGPNQQIAGPPAAVEAPPAAAAPQVAVTEPPAPQVPFKSQSPRVAPTAEEMAALRNYRPAGASAEQMGAFKFLQDAAKLIRR
jgi:hypothetical protein